MSFIKYKLFDQLMSSVESDLYTFADEGYFDRAKYIKEVRRVNSELGLRVNRERETILDVVDHTALLPDDFLFLQLALAISAHTVSGPKLQGAQTEAHSCEKGQEFEDDILVPNRACSCTLNSCPDRSCEGPCNNCIWITQKIGIKIQHFTEIHTLELTNSSWNRCVDTSLNFFFRSANKMRIEEDHATFSFRHGKVYINYLSDMVDDDNNVLVVDHPILNDYYEYAIKKKFFENMELNHEGDFVRDFQLVNEQYRIARIRAISFVNTPEYGEIIKTFVDNRNRFYKKYVRYFNEPNQGIFKGEPDGWHRNISVPGVDTVMGRTRI